MKTAGTVARGRAPCGRFTPALLLLAATLFAVPLLAGCGEKTFDAQGVVDALNAKGAGLTLGDSLPDTSEGSEVRVVTFAGGSGTADTVELGAGALVVLADSDTARGEFSRCQSAGEFVCFRAANTVLRFSQITSAEQSRLSAALEGIAGGG